MVRKMLLLHEERIYLYYGDVCVETNEENSTLIAGTIEKKIKKGTTCVAVDAVQTYCLKNVVVKCIDSKINQVSKFNFGLEHVNFVKKELADWILVFVCVISISGVCICINWLNGYINFLLCIGMMCKCLFSRRTKTIIVLLGLLVGATSKRIVPEDEVIADLEYEHKYEIGYETQEIQNVTLAVLNSVGRTLKSAALHKKIGAMANLTLVIKEKECRKSLL